MDEPLNYGRYERGRYCNYWELDDGNGRLALVARRFVERELDSRQARGITSGDRFATEWFDPVVRFEPIEPDSLRAGADGGE